MRHIACLLSIALVSACQSEEAYEEWIRKHPPTETSNGKEGVGSAEKPVGKLRRGIRFQQKGLEIDEAEIFIREDKPLYVEDSVHGADTIRMPLFIRGWHAPDGLARMKFSSVLRRPDGSIAQRHNDFKQIARFNVLDSVFGVEMEFSDLDTTLPYYDTEFTVTDMGNGRSLTGAYRYKLK